MNKKKKTFKQDEFVNYIVFPDSELLRVKKRSVILEVLSDGSYYDYEIFIDGEGIVRKVKEEDLFPLDQTK
jgi:hypothetical protein